MSSRLPSAPTTVRLPSSPPVPPQGYGRSGTPASATPSLSEVPHTMPLPLRRSGDWTPLVPKSTPSLPALVADGPSSVSEDPAGEAELRRLRKGGGWFILGCAAALLVGLAGSFAVVSSLGAPRAAAGGAVESAPSTVAAPPPVATVPPVASVLEVPAASAAPPASAQKPAKAQPRGK